MAEKFKNSKNRKLLALFLSVMMLSSTAAALASCNGDDTDSSSSDSSSESTVVPTDEAKINNGSFEFYDAENKTTPIITSVTGWSRSTNSSSSGTASTSQTASGIVLATEDGWKTYTQSAFTPKNKEEAKSNWDTMTVKDKLKFYEDYDPDAAGNGGTKLKDLDFYESFNIDYEDLPTLENNAYPGVHDPDNADNKSVLMIHNQYTGNRGTAQRYTSSSTVTLPAGTSATLSLWVKTADLVYGSTDGDEDNAQPVISNRGAYIGITHAIGGTTLDQFQVKNIVADDWTQYTFHLRGSSYASSTFTMVLGLGQGGGTDRWEYVNGYAFFDDVRLENDDIALNDDTFPNPSTVKTVGVKTQAEDKIFDANVTTDKVFAIDLLTPLDDYTLPSTSVALTEETLGEKTYVTGTGKYNVNSLPIYSSIGAGFDTTNDYVGLASKATLKGVDNQYLAKILSDDFADDAFVKDTDNVLMLMSAGGASYTAKVEDANTFVLGAEKYMAVSFFVKTSDLKGFTGAGVILKEVGNANSVAFSSIDTTSISPVEIGDNEDVYDGWQQCFFFIQNNTEEDITFTLSFTFGPTTIIDKTRNDFYAGYAAFTNFQTLSMSEKDYECAATGTYAKKVNLIGSEVTTGDSGFDADATVSSPANDKIEKGFATPKNYKGVVGGSGYVVTGGENIDVNNNQYAGLLNKDYIDEYSKQAWADGFNLTELFGDATQPLFIYNNVEQAYGYIGATQSLSANSYLAISLRVKTNATANVYLVDMSDTDSKSIMTVSRRVSYWYDTDGNVCVKDPTAKGFNEKTDIAFNYDEETGLYTANAGWSKASAYPGYYANLDAYTQTDDAGNKLVAKGGVSYNYSSKWNNEGMDGIAFYAKDGKYYADKATTVEVNNFPSSIARYNATEEQKLAIEIPNTNGVWKTVTFYLHAGNVDKSYRLEVWSGTRDGVSKNAAGTYVMFDSNNPGTLDEATMTALQDETVEKITDKSAIVYDTFSFYDSPKYLRYYKAIDENKVGNSYETYDSTANVEGIAYMPYENAKESYLFVNYALSEAEVIEDPVEDDSVTEEEEKAPASEMNGWLLASSISIAAVLLLAVISIIVRKVLAKVKRKKARAAAMQPKAKVLKPVSTRKPKKEKVEEETHTDENDPYND